MMSNTTVSDYIRLIRGFVNKEVDVLEFERTFLHMFKSQQVDLPEREFEILDALFSDVDSFCADPALRDETDLNEEQLRQRCVSSLKQLLG
jgi:hypothetical protein